MVKGKYWIVMPAHNESQNIGNVINRLRNRVDHHIVIVDDGSSDNTYNIASKIAEISVIRHKINIGKGAAMKTGADFAFNNGAEAVIFFDSDGQHKVEDLDKFLSKINKNNDIVFGSRNMSYGVPLVRYLGNKFAALFVSILFGIYISDLLCGYRAITKKAYKMIKWESSGYGVETEMVIRTALSKLKYCEVPVETVYLDRVKGVTLLDAANILMDVVRWKITL